MEVNLPQFSSFVSNLIIPVVYPDPDALLYVKNITGLEAVMANIVTRAYGTQDDEYLVGKTIGKRNIVITFGLNTKYGDVSVSEARGLLYGYMAPKSLVKFIFHTDDFNPVTIEGYIESMTPNRFSQDPEMQVSILCPKGNFLSQTGYTAQGYTGTNPSPTVLTYGGTVAVGVILDLAIGSYTGAVRIEQRIAGTSVYRTFELTQYTTYPSNSVLWMNSKKAQRVVYYKLSGIDTNLLHTVSDTYGFWPILSAGQDEFRVVTPASDTARLWHISYYEEFVGI